MTELKKKVGKKLKALHNKMDGEQLKGNRNSKQSNEHKKIVKLLLKKYKEGYNKGYKEGYKQACKDVYGTEQMNPLQGDVDNVQLIHNHKGDSEREVQLRNSFQVLDELRKNKKTIKVIEPPFLAELRKKFGLDRKQQ